MSTVSTAIATIPASERIKNMKFPFLYFPLHGVINGTDNASNAVDSGFSELNGQESVLFAGGTKSIQGTTTNIWTGNNGWITPGGDNAMTTNQDAGLKAFHRLDNLSGGLLIAFRFLLGANATAAEYIYGYSGTDNTNGGFEVKFESAGKITVAMREVGASGPTTILPTQTNPSTGVEHTCLIYLDTVSGTPVMYIDGIAQTTPTAMPTPLPTLGNDWSFMTRSNGGSLTNPINSQGTPARQLRDLLVVRCTSDIRADIPAIAQDYNDNLGEIPALLTTL